MKVSLIAAISMYKAIGKDGGIPWRASPDMKRFRDLTYGHPVIMGRLTHESIGHPLYGRSNIVMTTDYTLEGKFTPAFSVEGALRAAEKTKAEEVFVIGGETIYDQFMDIADTIYLTIVHGLIDGDTFFPPIGEGWKVVENEYHEYDEDECEWPLSFITLERINDDD